MLNGSHIMTGVGARFEIGPANLGSGSPAYAIFYALGPLFIWRNPFLTRIGRGSLREGPEIKRSGDYLVRTRYPIFIFLWINGVRGPLAAAFGRRCGEGR